ncbi:MAG: UDP-2,3-diacylglucosamine diphosphatase LpxI [Henriciella sp.]
MLERVTQLEPEIRGDASARRGVLVKRPKPIQERRIDLPTIGPATVRRAAAAGLAGIGVESDGALLLQREEIERLCASHGVFVYAFSPDWE